MSIIYSWINPNKTDVTKIEVYRSDKRGGDKTLLATLGTTALSYEDTSAVLNKVYFYSTIVYEGTLTNTSIEMPLASFETTGPGPATLLRGDWDYGYFGEIPAENTALPTLTELCSVLGVAYDSGLQYQHTKWHKWIVNGRILFIPSVWATLSGVRYTTTPNIFIPINGSESSALKWTKGDNNFYVRLPFANRLDAADNGGVLPLNNTAFPFYKSELCALAASFRPVVNASALPVIYNYADNNSIAGNGTQGFTNTWVNSTNMAGWNVLNNTGLQSISTGTSRGAYAILSLKFG